MLEKYKCDVWFKDNSECFYKSSTPTDMLKHIKSVHVDEKIERHIINVNLTLENIMLKSDFSDRFYNSIVIQL